MIKVSLLIRTVQKEKERIDYMLIKYLQQLEKLPKGSIMAKNVGKNTYYYLKYLMAKRLSAYALFEMYQQEQSTFLS